MSGTRLLEGGRAERESVKREKKKATASDQISLISSKRTLEEVLILDIWDRYADFWNRNGNKKFWHPYWKPIDSGFFVSKKNLLIFQLGKVKRLKFVYIFSMRRRRIILIKFFNINKILFSKQNISFEISKRILIPISKTTLRLS